MTAVFAFLLIAVLVFVQLRRGPEPIVSAEELLKQSTVAEESVTARTDQILHRTINFEEKKVTGELIAQRRIEVWQSAERGVVARRLYDERGELVAGDWRRRDGVQTLYHHGTRPQLRFTPERAGVTQLSFDAVWLLCDGLL